jgi:hypothetical protein
MMWRLSRVKADGKKLGKLIDVKWVNSNGEALE